MAKMDRRREREAKLKFIHQARVTHEIQQVVSLLKDIYEEKRDALVEAQSSDFVGKQAEARTYRDIIRLLTNDRPQIEPAQETA